ncbi:MAG: hypothetical protein A2252_04495 [Elusimicrobia bacterium RIFOXYA2_FULL_39_19]|nr:MAG: hypothetical protein A2252_04495 [Elusimicrobia bacterium RIFOXYA2_FULL_39_19]
MSKVKISKRELWIAIGRRCRACQSGPTGVKLCQDTRCALFPYKFGLRTIARMQDLEETVIPVTQKAI